MIRVAAAGINPADVFQRLGMYDPPPGATHILGLECAGVVVEIGEGVSDLAVGGEVCALLPGGGYAEYVAVPSGQVAPKLAGLTMIESAILMEVAATVRSNFFMDGRLHSGETVLVHGGSSGIGTMAIQMAKARGAQVVVTVGSKEKAEACERLGSDLALNYR